MTVPTAPSAPGIEAHRETEAPAHRIALVVINYNDRTNLRSCLASVPEGAEVVLVDNGSHDGSVAMVRTEFPQVRIVADGTNPGYGAAANKGVAACSGEYVLILNSDTRLDAPGIEALARYLEAHPGVAVVGPRMLNPDGSLQPSCFPFPGTLGWLLENEPVAWLASLVPPLRRRLYRFAPPLRSEPVPWLLGAALAVRRSAFDAVGGFDPTFFLYFEEVDLCARLRERGWEVHFTPSASIVHVGSASTSAVRQWAAIEHFRSNLRYYRRYLRGAPLALWFTIMRVKMTFRLLRDIAAWVGTGDAEQRARLWEDVVTWRRALRQTGR